FESLERWARDTFPAVGEVVTRWSGQVLEPTDGIAFIGRAPMKGEGVYVITGDSGMGLTHGTLGAMLVGDLILGRPNPWEQLYDPERKPLHSLKEYAAENVNAGAQWLELVTPGDTDEAATIAPGCGAVMRRGLSKLAVYRDEQGKLHTCSAICPHLGAVVRWNPIERSWDCPTHGSRFSATGELLFGPATSDLAERTEGFDALKK
ncbi:MAG: FAD-dependent oxidoreductase, partial [Deltaproteobacteria bacterium]|nr:FAD-dependent oxidoreductase [Nannocystaceae bacterium]